MSPSWLLAVACACAGLLYARAGAVNGQCASVMRGVETNNMLPLPATAMNAGNRRAEVSVPNGCATALFGQRVTVCDADVAPDVLAPAWPGISPVVVQRRGALLTPAYVYVYQYCSPH